MNTVHVTFSNHFDLVWRRPWAVDCLYQGKRYLGYRQLQNLLIRRNLDLAEDGRGAYMLEQGLSLRAYLDEFPDERPRLKSLYDHGHFEMLGAGEAIIDVNMCMGETMVRNLASGMHLIRDELGMDVELACHNDGFGSSAQFPQVMRGCGLRGIRGMSYSYPDQPYWQGLDGSTVAFVQAPSGRTYFYDHCYHEPCRECAGAGCGDCEETGLDLPQNWYPPFDPVPDDAFVDGEAWYHVCSEEMLPEPQLMAILDNQQTPGVQYKWSTLRALRHRHAAQLAAVDAPPQDAISSKVENNPVQTGCYVSRLGIKLGARRCEALFYGWERALALTAPELLATPEWKALFLELPLFFFHDAITGTHQDQAYDELMARMTAMTQSMRRLGSQALQETGGEHLQLFNPGPTAGPVRGLLEAEDWRTSQPLVAITEDGQRFPVILPLHRFAPELPTFAGRWVAPVGPSARTRPERVEPELEATGLAGLAWTSLRVEEAAEPAPITTNALRNDHLDIELGEHGIGAITRLATGAVLRPSSPLGHLTVEEDEGDPWGTRKPSSLTESLAPFTKLLGALRFDGYSEAYYAGRYEPNLPFGREADPAIFGLSWYLTVRLLDGAERVDFSYEIFWKASNRRIRAIFPVSAPSDEAWYSVPAGWLARPRYEQTETCLWSPNGDWPALYGVAAKPDMSGCGWAVMNEGTPSTRVVDGAIQISVLRSPGFGHCLERYGQDYPMPTSGIRDGGYHQFRLSLVPHAGETDMPRIMVLGDALNQRAPVIRRQAPPTAASLAINGDGLEILSVKRGFGDDGLVVRLVNMSPEANTVQFCGVETVRRLDMTEKPAAGSLSLRPFEIATFGMEMK